jgi:3',5'-cyclic AMP phosphodiesterase CpdA
MAVKFIHITDTHLPDAPDRLVHGYCPGHVLEAVLRELKSRDAHGADFLIHTGDLALNPKTPEGYGTARRIFGLEGNSEAPGPLRITALDLNLPFYLTPGNADNRSLLQQSLFTSRPVEAMNFAFEIGETRFLTVDWAAEGQDNYDLRPETLSWLGDQLRIEQPTVIFVHHPMTPVGAEWLDAQLPSDLNRLVETIRGRPILAILHGHTHRTWDLEVAGVPSLGCGSITSQFSLLDRSVREIRPPQYRVVRILDETVSSEVFEVEL